METYERICPGSTNRILTAFEKEQEHRQDMDRKIFQHESKIAYTRLGAGLLVVLLILLFGGICVYAQAPATAISAIVSIGAVYIVHVLASKNKGR